MESWGESLFYFLGACRISIYFKGATEQALNFRELGSTVKNAYDLYAGEMLLRKK